MRDRTNRPRPQLNPQIQKAREEQRRLQQIQEELRQKIQTKSA